MELFDLYDKNRNLIGKTIERGKPLPENCYRLVVHICVFNSKGEMLIQQRQPFKKSWSNLWDISVGGGVVSGETSQIGASRELKEELGIDYCFENEQPILTVNFDNGFDDYYVILKDIEISELSLQYEEVQRAKWATANEIVNMIEEDTFIPYHKALIKLLFSMRNKKGAHTRECI